jgi:enterochelin esterase-like enzyme
MRRTHLLVLAVLVLVLSAGVAADAARKRTSSTLKSIGISCRAPSLGGTMPAQVYLPAGYRGTSERYPVVYFLHGLPAGPTSYQGSSFIAAAIATGPRKAIVVAPQGARRGGDDREYLDWSATENWPRAISHDLTSCIDKRFRTIADRRGRALVGLSAGGFGAFNIGLRSLREFAAVESWSGYFAATDPAGYHLLTFSSPVAAAAARVPDPPALAASLRRYPAFLGFYVGSGDDRFRQDNVVLDAQWRAAGISHWFAVYPGGHAFSLWAKWAPMWLGHALGYLTPAHVPRAASGRLADAAARYVTRARSDASR